MNVSQTAALTDAGRKRRRNEDAFVVQPPLFAVADGVGGAQAGELASRLAADALREEDAAGSAEERLVSLVREANRRVYERQSEDHAATGMGTTVTVALVEGDEIVLAHVGDSRAYRLRDGELEQLTEDHSLVQELMRDGKLTPEEAQRHPQKSVITRALGSDPDVDVDLLRAEARPGDLFLLCSDGLTDMVGEAAMLRIVEANRHDLDGVVRALVDAANAGGGEDNITVVCFEVGEPGSADETVALTGTLATAAEPDDEDTLSEIDAIPPVEAAPAATGTAIIPPEQARELAAEIRRRDRRAARSRPLAVAVVLLLLLVLAGVLIWYVAVAGE